MATKFQIKRTSVSGRTPNTADPANTSYIASGELAVNLTDQKLYSSNGTVAFEVGANLTSLVVNSSLTIGNSTVNTTANSTSITLKQIYANGAFGTSGQVLTSNGTGMYWAAASGGAGAPTITADSFTGNGSNTQFTLSTSATTKTILVYLNGVVQTPTTDYSVSGTTLTFVSAPANNDSIAVRIIDVTNLADLQITNDYFLGNGSNTQYTLGTAYSANAYSLVFLNGVAQKPTVDYGISGSTLTFLTAPPNNEQIAVFSINAVDEFVSDEFTGNGSNTVYTLSTPSTTRKTIVSLNGITQRPVTDYSVSGTTLTFVTAPANNDKVVVRSFYNLIDAGGTNTEIQYNRSGDLAGSAGFVFDYASNNVTIGNTLTVPNLRINASNPPANSTSTGSTGTVAWDSDYLYVAVGTNTWKKTLITTDGAGGGSANTAGSNTEIQFNDSGVLGANNLFTFNKDTSTLAIGSNVTVNTSTIFIGNSSVNTTITAGNVHLQGTQLTVGNVVLTGEQITIGNSTVNSVINSTGATLTGDVTFSGDLMPSANITYDIGNSAMRWRDLWLSGTTINLGGATIKTDTDTGAIAFVPKATTEVPNPKAVLISPRGGIQAVDTNEGAPVINNSITAVDGISYGNSTVNTIINSTSVSTGNSIIYANGTALFGTTTQLGKVTISDPGATTLTLERITNDSGPPEAIGRKARGTAGAKTGVLANDRLWFFAAAGYVGTEGVDGGYSANKVGMNFYASENWTSTAQGTHITFATTEAGQTTRTDKVIISGNGNVGIGNTVPANKLTVEGSAYITTTLTVGNSTVNSILTQTSLNVGGTVNATGNIATAGYIIPGTLGGLYGNVYITAANDAIGNSWLRIQSQSGYVDIGPKNTGYAHIETDRSRFYFSKETHVNGLIKSYQANNYLGDAGIVISNGNITVGNSTVNASITTAGVARFANTTVTGDLVVSGNVFFNGTTTNVNSTNLVVEDKNIIVGDVATPTDVTADGGGITLKGTTDKTLNWVDATDAWTSSEDFNLVSGKSYEINGTVVVNSTSLGTGITGSSLTSVGTLTTLAAGNTTISGKLDVSDAANIYLSSTGTYFSGGSSNLARRLTFATSTSANEGDTHTLNAGSATGQIILQTGSLERFRANSAGVQINGPLAAGNTTITGFANVSGNVYVGNSTVFLTANSTTINVGTTSVNSTVIAVGANVTANVTSMRVGNTISSSRIGNNIVEILTSDTTLAGTVQIIAGNSTVNAYAALTTQSNFGSLELGGTSGALIDFKLPYTDDYDHRIQSNSTGFHIVGGSSTAAANVVSIINANVSIDSGTLFVDSVNDRVGIGTTTPSARLDIIDSTNDVEVLRVRTSGGNPGATQGKAHLGLHYWNTGNNSPVRIGVEEINNGSYRGNLLFSTRDDESDSVPTEKVRIAANGNVGIGNSTPSSALSIKGNQLFISNTDTSTSIVIRNEGNNTTGRFPQLVVAHYSGNTTGGSAGGQPVVELTHYAGNTSAQQAVASGTILGGFNTWGSNSTAILSGTRIQGIAEAAFTSTATAGLQLITTNAGTQSEKVRIAANGNVGIGTTAPTVKLKLVSSEYNSASFTSAITAAPASADAGQIFEFTAVTAATGLTFASNDGRFLTFGADTSSRPYMRGRALNFIATTDVVVSPNQTTAHIFASNNNVGINTLTPGATLDVRGNVYVGGADAGPNFIAFRGTTGDQPGTYTHTYIGERIWEASEKSELFIFKGNDISGPSGPDRVRIGANEFRVDTYTGAALSGTFETVASSANLINRFIITGDGNVGIGTTAPSYKLQVNGSFAATTKSFVIDHPTKPGMQLRYGSLEGPENGVYVRGKLSGSNTIELPEYWTKLVDEETITVNLTPIGKHQNLYVKSISNNVITVGGCRDINCFYTVFGERKDVDKLQVELDNNK